MYLPKRGFNIFLSTHTQLHNSLLAEKLTQKFETNYKPKANPCKHANKLYLVLLWSVQLN